MESELIVIVAKNPSLLDLVTLRAGEVTVALLACAGPMTEDMQLLSTVVMAVIVVIGVVLATATSEWQWLDLLLLQYMVRLLLVLS